MLLKEWLSQVQKRCESATPGPWEVEGIGGLQMNGLRDGYQVRVGNTIICVVRLHDTRKDDAAFLAAARTDVPALCAAVRVLAEAIEAGYRFELVANRFEQQGGLPQLMAEYDEYKRARAMAKRLIEHGPDVLKEGRE